LILLQFFKDVNHLTYLLFIIIRYFTEYIAFTMFASHIMLSSV